MCTVCIGTNTVYWVARYVPNVLTWFVYLRTCDGIQGMSQTCVPCNLEQDVCSQT